MDQYNDILSKIVGKLDNLLEIMDIFEEKIENQDMYIKNLTDKVNIILHNTNKQIIEIENTHKLIDDVKKETINRCNVNVVKFPRRPAPIQKLAHIKNMEEKIEDTIEEKK